jgi:hypothetical protein
MGYTVSWTQNRSFTDLEWQQITDATRSMFNRLKQVKDGDGTGRPQVGTKGIIFNGDASKGEDYETFQLMKNGYGFNFCKTARKPYDRYVKAVLVVANYYAPGALEVSCDGDDEPDCWTEGVRIAEIYAKPANGTLGSSPCSPKETKRLLELMAWKSTEIAHTDPYKGVYPELDNIIKGLEMVSSDSKPLQFLVNYLKANIDDIKDAYTP